MNHAPRQFPQRWIYFWIGVGICLGLFTACELKFPTIPGLPARWNTKLVLPFLERSYTFADLEYRGDNLSNPIYADTSGDLYFTASDSTLQPITIDPVNCWLIPAYAGKSQLELRRTLKWRTDSTVVPYRTTLKVPLSQIDNKIKRGKLASDPNHNRLQFVVTLSDAFPNQIKIYLASTNFKIPATGAFVVDSVLCGGPILADTVTIDLSSDSAITSADFLDTLSFTLEVEVSGKLSVAPSRLSQKLSIELAGTSLKFSAFTGILIAHGYVSGLSLVNSPTGSDGITFESAYVRLNFSADLSTYESVYCQFTGKRRGTASADQDTLLTLPVIDDTISIPHALSNLPDSLQFYLSAYTKLDDYHSGNLPVGGVDARYALFLPLKFTLPNVMTIAAGKSSRYFIKDSTTRTNVLDGQNGVEFDFEVENFSPLTGTVHLLISNFDLFPFDTVGNTLPAGFFVQGGQVFYANTDTVVVRIDTLLTLELPEAETRDDRVVISNRAQQIFRAQAGTVAFFADTCYLKPYFRLVNPQGKRAVLNRSQYIKIRSYLNLLLVADAIKN